MNNKEYIVYFPIPEHRQHTFLIIGNQYELMEKWLDNDGTLYYNIKLTNIGGLHIPGIDCLSVEEYRIKTINAIINE